MTSHKTESVFGITQGRGGEGEAALRQKTVEEQEGREGEKQGIVLDWVVELNLAPFFGELCRKAWRFFHLGGFPFLI